MRIAAPLLLLTTLAAGAGCSRNGAPMPEEASVIMFRGADGRVITMDDLRGLTGPVRYEGVGRFDVPAEAEALHGRARRAGGSGDYEGAVALLERAVQLAPQWPYPVYDLAFTYLLMGDAAKAREYYRKTVELAPRGFFTSITALHALDQEAAGVLPDGTYAAYLALEWVGDPDERARMVRQLVERVPAFAPGWKELALLTEDDTERLRALERGLAADPDAETEGVLLINKALILDRSGDRDGAVDVLGELALDPASTYAAEHLAKVALATVVMSRTATN